MSFIDILAWIVLIVFLATGIAVFVALGMMPGRIARRRGHPWVEAVTVGGWATYTDHVTASHVIRKVVLRQTAIMNYLNPF